MSSGGPRFLSARSGNKKLEDHNCTNIQQWKEAILKVWLERTEECQFLQNLVTSMPTRMLEVIEREGGMTRY